MCFHALYRHLTPSCSRNSITIRKSYIIPCSETFMLCSLLRRVRCNVWMIMTRVYACDGVCIAVPTVRWRSVRSAAVRRLLSSSLLAPWQASRQLPETQDSVLGKETQTPTLPPPLPNSRLWHGRLLTHTHNHKLKIRPESATICANNSNTWKGSIPV